MQKCGKENSMNQANTTQQILRQVEKKFSLPEIAGPHTSRMRRRDKNRVRLSLNGGRASLGIPSVPGESLTLGTPS